SVWFFLLSFFFQAEAGIRDFHVTGVQTCALPIYFILFAPWLSSPLYKTVPKGKDTIDAGTFSVSATGFFSNLKLELLMSLATASPSLKLVESLLIKSTI